MSSTLPPSLTGSSITGNASHTVITLTFNQQIESGSGTIIVTDGALQTVIDRGTGLPTLRIAGATETHQIPLSMVGIDGNTATINADGLSANHHYHVYILPGALQANGQPFAGVTSASQLAFTTPAPADTTPPALLQMSLDNYALSGSKGANLTLTFTESVSVDPSALQAPNVSIANLSSSDGGFTWHATVAANPGLQLSNTNLSLDMSKVHDRANNVGSGSSLLTYSIDTKAPTVSSIALSGATPVLASGATVTVTFSENVDLSTSGAPLIAAPNATVSGLHTIDGGITWVATLTPQSGTLASGNQLTVDLSQVRDRVGNAGAGIVNAPSTYTVDTQGPAFDKMSLSGAILSQSRTLDVTIQLKQAVPSFDPAAISAPNASVTGVHTTDNGQTWIATLRPNSGTSISHNTLSLDMSLLRDANGVPGSGVQQIPNAYSVDTVAPTATLSLSGSKVTASSPVTVTMVFSEVVSSLDPAAIKAPNVALVDLASADGGLTWVAKLVPTTDSGTASGQTVSLDMSKVRDLAGNTGSGTVNSAATYGVDIQPPTASTITLSDNHVTSTTGPTMTITFSEAVSLDASAFTLPHATLAGLHSADGITWSGTVLSDGSGNATGNTVLLDMAKVKDLYGNTGSGTVASGNYDVQVTAPTATISLSGNQVTKHTSVTVTVVFSQAVKALDPSFFSTQANIVVSNLSSSDGKTWTGTLSTNANVQAVHNVFSLDMSKVQDLFGNFGSGTASASSQYDIDTVAPTATMSLTTDHLTPTSPATLTITFSEPVTGLDISDFSTPHAQLTNLKTTDNGKTWQATLSAAAGTTGSTNQVALDMSKLADLAGNAGTGTPTVQYNVDYPVTQGVSVSLDNTQLASGSDIVVTLHFNVAVDILNQDAISAPNTQLQHLHTTDNGQTWYLVLTPTAGVADDTNVVSVDLSKLSANPALNGSGIVTSANYTVDSTVSAYAQSVYINDDNGPSMFDLVTNQHSLYYGGALQGTLAAGQHIEVTIDSVQMNGAFASGSSWALLPTTAPTLADGKHTITVRVVDSAGHASTAVSKDIIIDSVAPKLAGTSLAGDGQQAPAALDVNKPLTISFDEAVYWHAVSSSVATTDGQVYRDGDNAVKVSDDASGRVSWVYIDQRSLSTDGKTLSLAAEDLHLESGKTYTVTLPVALTDLAGNGVATNQFHVTATGTYADTAAPYALSAQVLNSPNVYGIGQAIHIAVRFNEPVTVKSGSTPYLSLSNDTQAQYVNASADGRTLYFDYTIKAGDKLPADTYGWVELKDTGNLASSVLDLAGNALDAAHIQFTDLTNAIFSVPGSGIGIDVTPPVAIAAPQLDPATDSGTAGDFITNGAGVVHGTGADAHAMIYLYDLSGAVPNFVGETYADDSGNWTYNAYWLGDGTYKLAAVQLDQAMNESAMSGTLSITIDTVAKEPSDIHLDTGSDTGVIGDMITSSKTPTLAGSDAEPGARLDLYNGSTLVGSTVADAHGAWSIKASDLGEGSHWMWLQETDIAGNQNSSMGVNLTVDATPPAQLLAPQLDAASDSGVSNSDGITNVTRPLVKGGGAEANATIQLYDGDTLLGTTTSDNLGNWQVKPDAAHVLLDGAHALTVRQVDVADNAGAKSAPLNITIDTLAPTVAANTSKLPLGSNFEIWFSEPVVHSGLTNFASVNINAIGDSGPALLSYALSDNNSWSDNVMRDGHLTSVYHFTPSNTGWFQADLSGIQDAAGNVATIGVIHREFTVDFSGTSFYQQHYLL